jgi:Arc/MetJ-type ribon-helix-helix transcriptional regulator
MQRQPGVSNQGLDGIPGARGDRAHRCRYNFCMSITLTPADHAWLTRQVAAGRFPSLDAALSAAIAELKAHDAALDLAWAKPLLDAARAAIGRGEGVPVDEAIKHWDETLARLRR